VAHSTIRDATLNYDPEPAAKACKIPMAYISADVPLVNMARDLDRLQQLCPQLATNLMGGSQNFVSERSKRHCSRSAIRDRRARI
jgi:hypothetical protein